MTGTDRFETTERRCFLLLGSLVFYLAVHPFLFDDITGRILLGVVMMLVLLGGVHAVSSSRRHLIRVGILAVVCIVALGRYFIVGETRYPVIYLAIGLFCLSVIVSMMSFVMQRGVASRARLIAALSVYLLFGMVWSCAYGIIDAFEPGAFYFGVHAADGEQVPLSVFTYYSYVTLTTLGYGDIQPTGPVARSASVLESITGVLFIAVMIASLVSYTDGPRGARDDD